jgi:hypothetical protein
VPLKRLHLRNPNAPKNKSRLRIGQPGHPRYGGRQHGALSVKRRAALEVLAELEETLGKKLNPLEAPFRLGNDESVALVTRG